MGESAKYCHLDNHERAIIEVRTYDGWSPERIAAALGRAPSTVRRELSRNASYRGYRARTAQVRADQRRRHQLHWLDEHPDVAHALVVHLADHRSVRQACALLAHDGIATPSHESVYRWMYQSTSPLAGQARQSMIRPRRRRRRRASRGVRGCIPNMRPLSDRPDGRGEPGHLEGDLVCGPGRAAVATLVDRATRHTWLVPVADRTTGTVTDAVAELVGRLDGLVKTIAWDRGKEMTDHERLTATTGVPVYFAAAHAPWQRGTNENTNGVLRRKLPKGTDLATVTDARARQLETWLNGRPMPTLSGATPTECLTRELRALRT